MQLSLAWPDPFLDAHPRRAEKKGLATRDYMQLAMHCMKSSLHTLLVGS